jgi:hypothetical protein
MRTLFAALVLAGLATPAAAGTLCPDGSFAPGDSCLLSADGKFVIGGPPTLPPDVVVYPGFVYVEGRSVVVYRPRFDEEYRIGRPQRNRILDAPAGTPAIDIPRLDR